MQKVPGFIEGTEYNSLGLLEEVRAANGLRNFYNFDNNSRIEGISYQRANQELLKDYSISYDNAGNIATLNDNSYTYDNINRLIFADLVGKFENIPQEENQLKYRTLDDYDGQNPLTRDHLIENKAEIVELDYAAGSIAAGIGDTQRITRVELKGVNVEHRIEERQLTVYYGTNGEEFTEIEDYQLIKDTIRVGAEDKAKMVIIFEEPVEAKYIKVKTDFNDRDENFEAVKKAEFYNTAEDIIDIYYYVTSREEIYQYDAAGNRASETINDWRNTTRGYNYYSNSNQVKSNDDFAFIYDDNGNMIKRGRSYTISGDSVTIATDDEYWEYQYDLLDRLIKVKENGITVAEYAYNHRGLRVRREDYKSTGYYIFNLNDEVIYEQENGEYTEYIYVRGQHFARRDGNLLSTETTTYFYHTDHLGSTVMVTDIEASIVWSSEYTPFGLLTRQEGEYDFQKAQKFTGKDLDQATGLYYYNARWYYAEIGRFISADSYKGELVNPQTLNLYVYVLNNLMKYIDPTGHWEVAVQERTGGRRSVYVRYEDDKINATLRGIVNALPLGYMFDYESQIARLSKKMLSFRGGSSGNLVNMYTYQPDEQLFERFKKLDVGIAGINDSLDLFGGYALLAEQFASPIAQNIINKAGPIITTGLILYDIDQRYDRVERDRYLRGMIRASGIEKYLDKINNPEDLFITMTYIEQALDSHGKEKYQIYNRYFVGNYITNSFGINDYRDDVGVSRWDRLLGNEEKRKIEREKYRSKFREISNQLRRDFEKDALGIEE